jgi:hypothetical protein
LIHLARANHFDLLHALFRPVLIPPAVYQEVAVRGQGQDGSEELARAKWIERRRPRRTDIILALSAFLGRGEVEAIALAAERKGSLLLIDEAQGRRAARSMGIAIRGTLGVLLQGHRTGHVVDLVGAIKRMREHGTWIDDDLIATVLAAARSG